MKSINETTTNGKVYELSGTGKHEKCAYIRTELHEKVRHTIDYCQSGDGLTFFAFEKALLGMMAGLGRLFIHLFLCSCHNNLKLDEWLSSGLYRMKDKCAERTIKTVYGPVTYMRTYLLMKKGKAGFFPLDARLGLTCDGFSPQVISLSARLATRMSFGAAVTVFRYFLEWSPSTETIECFVLGLGKQAGKYTEAAPPPEGDGEVLVIEVDGKATPTATDAELSKRRGKRKKKKHSGGKCGCQRHRGRERRHACKKCKKRRKKGDKSKNGRSITLVVMYTLKRSADGRLHGPINKRVWGTYAPRKYAFSWARAQATKRGFPPDTDKKVEIVIDGERCLYQGLKKLFKNAIFALDIMHLKEKLWDVGRTLYKEGSWGLEHWVGAQETLLYNGDAPLFLETLRDLYERAPGGKNGVKTQRKAMLKLINYMEPRLDMMRYADLIEQDLVIASGVVEGAARYVVGERMDCAGMRWIRGRAEALLHLRCLELNGQWDAFFEWSHQQWCSQLRERKRVQIRNNDPIPLPQAA